MKVLIQFETGSTTLDDAHKETAIWVYLGDLWYEAIEIVCLSGYELTALDWHIIY